MIRYEWSAYRLEFIEKMIELDAYGKQVLKKYGVDSFHSINGQRYLEICSELKKVCSKAGINLPTNPPPILKSKLIDIVEIFVKRDESFLSFIESKVINPSGGQRHLSFDDYKMICRFYAIQIVEKAWK